MNTRTISDNLRKIDNARKQGYLIEALVSAYHMNVRLMMYILSRSGDKVIRKNTRIKPLLRSFVKARKKDPSLKALIDGHNLKSVKIWFDKSDDYFKKLKMQKPYNTRRLLDETTKIASILNVSARKLSIRKEQASA